MSQAQVGRGHTRAGAGGVGALLSTPGGGPGRGTDLAPLRVREGPWPATGRARGRTATAVQPTEAAHPTRPHLRVVDDPRPRMLAFAVVTVVVCAAAVFATLVLGALAAEDAVAVRSLRQQVATAERRYERLVADVAALENPARVERVATGELGMVRPKTHRYLLLSRPLTDSSDPGEPHTVVARPARDPLKLVWRESGEPGSGPNGAGGTDVLRPAWRADRHRAAGR